MTRFRFPVEKGLANTITLTRIYCFVFPADAQVRQGKKVHKKKYAPAGNRTRVYRVAGGNYTTKPPALLLDLIFLSTVSEFVFHTELQLSRGFEPHVGFTFGTNASARARACALVATMLTLSFTLGVKKKGPYLIVVNLIFGKTVIPSPGIEPGPLR
jgi:hypothetical protein